MKSILTAFATLALSSAAFASSQANYSFVADNSTRAADGSCIASVIQIAQVGSVLILSNSADGTSQVIALKPPQVSGFKRLANRSWGQSRQIAIQDGDLKLSFDGESCGSLQCDSVTLQNGKAAPVRLEQPIHGLTQIGCQ